MSQAVTEGSAYQHEPEFRLLAAVDGSDAALRACRLAAAVAPPGTDIRVVTVLSFHLDPWTPLGESTQETEDMIEELELEIDRLTGEAVDIFHGAGLRTDIYHRFGNPADEIVGEIEESQPDLVAIGRRGMSGVKRWLLGSVSSRVLHHAQVPILVVP